MARKTFKEPSALPKLAASLIVFLQILCWSLPAGAKDCRAIVVSAEGLVDPNSETYSRDKGLMLDDLRKDARKQVVEKAVGVHVESSSLVENYALIHDRILTQSSGLIKRVIKESPPWIAEDGFAHLLMKAEVCIDDVRNALEQMSRKQRIMLIQERGNPKISVAITIRDADRDLGGKSERSAIAENVLKERLSEFGYRVWSEETSQKLRMELAERSVIENLTETTISISHLKDADFKITGEAKFKKLTVTLRGSGITIEKYVLTSWTVKCIDSHTGEEIYFNNKVPQRSWTDEDAAIEDIGRLMGDEFSTDFFEQHLQKPTTIFQLQVLGLPSYDMGQMIKKEFIGLRHVLNIDLREFDESGISSYEVEYAGDREEFSQFVSNVMIKPLNSKLGEECFKMASAHGSVVRVTSHSNNLNDLLRRLTSRPPASLVDASPERLKDIIRDEQTLEKVAEINPKAAGTLTKEGFVGSDQVVDAVRDF